MWHAGNLHILDPPLIASTQDDASDPLLVPRSPLPAVSSSASSPIPPPAVVGTPAHGVGARVGPHQRGGGVRGGKKHVVQTGSAGEEQDLAPGGDDPVVAAVKHDEVLGPLGQDGAEKALKTYRDGPETLEVNKGRIEGHAGLDRAGLKDLGLDRAALEALQGLARGRDLISVWLERTEDSPSLGFGVVGLRVDTRGQLGIFVLEIQPGGVADR